MTERLTEDYFDDMQKITRHYAKSNNIDLNTGGNDFQDIIDKLAEYENAEEEGRLVVLPCKAGDTVWTFYDDMSDVVDFTVEKIQIEFDKNGKPYFLIDGMDFEEDCLGRTLFFDREEAEKALKEMEGK